MPAAVTATLTAASRAEAAGGPDGSLAGTGTLTVDWSSLIGEPGNTYLRDVVRDDAGRWLLAGDVVGRDDNAPTLSVLQRLQPDGTPDPTFGTASVVTSAGFGLGPAGKRLAVLPAGDIVLDDYVLDTNGAYRNRITVPATGIPGIGAVAAVLALPDGMLVMAGFDTDRGLRVATTNPNPLAVMSSQLLTIPGPTVIPTSVALEDDATGRVFVTVCTAAAPCRVVAFTPGFERDTSYGVDGVVTLRSERCTTSIAADGFLASGCTVPGETTTILDRYDARGQHDDTFGAALPFEPLRVRHDGAGAIVVAHPELGGLQPVTTLQRFFDDGTYDPSFGGFGLLRGPFVSVGELRAWPGGGLYQFGYAPDPPNGPIRGWLFALTPPLGTALQPPVAGTARFVASAPTRLLDTRDAGAPAPGPGGVVRLPIAGHGPVPASGVTAAVLNVTATEAAGPGYVTAWPAGAPRPLASNLNLVRAGVTAANLVVVPLGVDGAVDLFTQSGTHLVADLAGWFEAADHATAGRFRSTPAPFRVLDTRDGTGAPAGKPGPDGTLTVHVTGVGGVPATGVAAVVVNLTGTDATADGYVTAWPAGTAQPLASNLNLVKADTRANLAIVPVSPAGDIALYTQSGTHLVADVAGWFTDASAPDDVAGLFVAVPPRRMLDSRVTGPAVAPSFTLTRRIGGTPVVPPALADAVVANVTATEAVAEGYVTAWPAGTDLPLVSTLNLPGPGWTVPNLAVVRLHAESVSVYTQRPAQVIVDVAGWFVGDGVAAG